MSMRASMLSVLCCGLVACDYGPVEVATYKGKPPPAPPVVAPPAPPPPEPAYTPALDAAEAVDTADALDPSLRGLLRGLQHLAGERPAILNLGAWTDRGDAVIAAVAELPDHGVGLDAALRRALQRAKELRADIHAFEGWSGRPNDDGAQVNRLVEADHLLAHMWLQAAEHYGATSGFGPEDAQAMRVRLLEALASWEDPHALAGTLPPPMAQYHGLVEAFAAYRALRDEGFVSVPKSVRKARPDKAHADLPALRARLAQEDPLGAGEGEVWDEALTEALRRARQAYQLKPKRKAKYLVDKALLAALAVPVTERLETIELNLRRWHRSDLRHMAYAIFVNLPDYHGEVWDGAELLRRFKVVIGNTRKKRGFMVNATPVLTARVDTIVYNPYWTVPKRIYEEELRVAADKYEEEQLAKIAEGGGGGEPAPDYWESRGYDVFGEDRSDGQIWVRRRPGPGNALGKVKFLFENRWFVFLHDTPQKRKFKHTRRAFSHGCMRVHKPLELAELLLKRDGSWGQVEEANVMKHYKQTVIDMKSAVWLVVDYLTVRVAPDGRLHFFADIYRKDAQAVASK